MSNETTWLLHDMILIGTIVGIILYTVFQVTMCLVETVQEKLKGK